MTGHYSKRIAAAIWKVGLQLAFLLALFLSVLASSPLHAQVMQRSFLNMSFEEPVLPGNCWAQVNHSLFPGWNTSHPNASPKRGSCGGTFNIGAFGPVIEIWRNFSGVAAANGNQFVELNADVSSRISQNVCLLQGETVNYRFLHRGRAGLDRARLLIGPQPIIDFGSGTAAGTGRLTSVTLGTASVTSQATWSHYSGSFVNNFVTGTTNIGFEAISASGGASIGNFLDNVQVMIAPFVEYNQETFSSIEGDSAGAPNFFLIGDFENETEIFFRVTGGTADATDYTFNADAQHISHGNNVYSVKVPKPATPNAYARGIYVDLGLRAAVDSQSEEAETVVIELFEPEGVPQPAYRLSGTEVCGGAPRSTSTWTIRNASPALDLVKSAALVDSNANGYPDGGDTVHYSFKVTNSGSEPLTAITVADPLLGAPLAVGDLVPGESRDLAVSSHAILPGNIDPVSGEYPNTAQANGLFGARPITSPDANAVVVLNANPQITLRKDGRHDDGATGVALADQRVYYSFTITNSGNTVLNDIRLSDSLLGWNERVFPGTLAPGDSFTYETTQAEAYVLRAADLRTGSLDNRADVKANAPRPDGGVQEVTSTADDHINLPVAVRLALQKTASTPVGRDVVYTFNIQNTGSVPVSNVRIDDPMFPAGTAFICANTSYPVPSLESGARVSCSVNYRMSDAEIVNTTLVNTARAVGENANGVPVISPPSTVTVNVPAIYGLEIVKTSDTTEITEIGQLVTYSVTATNTSNRDLTNVMLRDARLTPSSSLCATLAVGASCVLTGSYRATAEDFRADSLLNTASATATQIPQPVTTNLSLPVVASDLEIIKTIDNATPSVGSEVVFTLNLRNLGGSDASGVEVTDLLPAGYTYVSDDSLGNYNATTGLWVVDTLAQGATRSLKITASVNASGPYANTARVEGDQVDPVSPNNSSTVEPTILYAQLTLAKEADQIRMTTLGDVNYKITLTNNGAVTIPRGDLTLSDELTIGSRIIALVPVYASGDDGDDLLEPGEAWVYATRYSVSQAELDAGEGLSNIVRVSAQQLTGDVSSPPAVTELVHMPAVNVVKTGTKTANRVDYRIEVFNIGNVTLTMPAPPVDQLTTIGGANPRNLTLVFDGSASSSGATEGLIPVGGSQVWTVSHDLAQSDIDAGGLRNIVTIKVLPPLGKDPADLITDSDDVATPVGAEPRLEVLKTAVRNGDDIDYRVEVLNTGNVTLSTPDAPEDEMTMILGGSPRALTLVFDRGESSSEASATVIPVGAKQVWTLNYRVTQDDIDAGGVKNTATAKAFPPGRSDPSDMVTDSDDEDTPITDAVPAVQVVKTAVRNGNDIDYRVEVQNVGRLTLTMRTPPSDVMTSIRGLDLRNLTLVFDPSASGVGATETRIPVGEKQVWTLRYALSQADIDAGGVKNTATVDVFPPSGRDEDRLTDSDDITTPVGAEPNLDVLKTAVMTDGVIDYRIEVRNTGNVTLNMPSAPVDEITTLQGGTAQPLSLVFDGDQSSSGVSAILIPVGGVQVWTVRYAVTQDDIDAGGVKNYVVARAFPPGTTDPAFVVSDHDDVDTPILALPDLRVTKTALRVGDRIDYRVEVENTGNVTLSMPAAPVDQLTTISGDLPRNLALVFDQNASTNGATADQLPVNEMQVWTYSYALSQADIDAGGVKNTVTAHVLPPRGTDPTHRISKTDDVETPIEALPAIEVVKTAVRNDKVIDYRIEVKNTGNVTLSMPRAPIDRLTTIEDDLPRDLALAFSAGESRNGATADLIPVGALQVWTVSYTMSQADIDAGGVKNSVTASVLPPGGSDPTDLVTEGDEVETPVTLAPAMTLLKTVELQAAGEMAQAGDLVVYRYRVENTGNTTLTNVTVTEASADFTGTNPLSPPSWRSNSAGSPAGVLLPGETAEFSADYRLSAEDLNAGELRNIASVSGMPPAGLPPVSDRSHPTSPAGDGETILPLTQAPTIQLDIFVDETRDLNGDGLIGEGDQLVYRFEVENTGNVVLSDVNLVPGSLSLPMTGLVCEPISLAPGERAILSCVGAVHTIRAEDVARGEVVLTGEATGVGPSGETVNDNASAPAVPAQALPAGLEVEKLAGVETALAGDQVPYQIILRNRLGAATVEVMLRDTLPEGFSYRAGTAELDGEAVDLTVEGRKLSLGPITLTSGQSRVLTMQTLVGSSVRPGAYVNRVRVSDPQTGEELAPEATATVRVLADAVMQCASVIGRVFDDVDQNGDMSEHAEERGLPNVRLVAPNGVSILTDEHGRFNVPCAALPRAIGSNFMLKIDERSLPAGYRMTTENPRVVRLTPGMITRMDFGATLARLVQIDLAANAFGQDEAGKPVMVPALEQGLVKLVSEIRDTTAMLRLTYLIAPNEPEELAKDRMALVERALRNLWSREGNYKLNIETLLQRVGAQQ